MCSGNTLSEPQAFLILWLLVSLRLYTVLMSKRGTPVGWDDERGTRITKMSIDYERGTRITKMSSPCIHCCLLVGDELIIHSLVPWKEPVLGTFNLLLCFSRNFSSLYSLCRRSPRSPFLQTYSLIVGQHKICQLSAKLSRQLYLHYIALIGDL